MASSANPSPNLMPMYSASIPYSSASTRLIHYAMQAVKEQSLVKRLNYKKKRDAPNPLHDHHDHHHKTTTQISTNVTGSRRPTNQQMLIFWKSARELHSSWLDIDSRSERPSSSIQNPYLRNRSLVDRLMTSRFVTSGWLFYDLSRA